MQILAYVSLFQVLIHVSVYALDRLIHGPFSSTEIDRKSFNHDLFSSALEIFNLRVFIGRISLLGFSGWIYSFKTPYRLLSPLDQMPVLQFCLYILLFDVLFYWTHRLRHLWPFWIEHEYHHSATHLSPLTDMRLNSLSYTFQFLTVFGPMHILTGNYRNYDLLVLPFTYLIGAFAHSRFDTSYGWLGKYLIVSPQFHRAHHSVKIDWQNKNFGSHFVIWDRMFGTYQEPHEAFSFACGLAEANRFSTQGPVQSYVGVYFRFAGALGAIFKGATQSRRRLFKEKTASSSTDAITG